MIIKLHLNSDQLAKLNACLLHDDNFWDGHVDKEGRRNFVRIMRVKNADECVKLSPVPDFEVTLVVAETFYQDVGRIHPASNLVTTPLQKLYRVFEAIDLFPKEEKVIKEGVVL